MSVCCEAVSSRTMSSSHYTDTRLISRPSLLRLLTNSYIFSEYCDRSYGNFRSGLANATIVYEATLILRLTAPVSLPTIFTRFQKIVCISYLRSFFYIALFLLSCSCGSGCGLSVVPKAFFC